MRFGFLAAVAARVVRGRKFARILTTLEQILMTQQELLAELQDVKAKFTTGIAALQAAIAKQGDVIPELKQAGDDLEAMANALTPPTPPAA